MARWQLDDYSTGSLVSITFDINPNTAELPNHSANFTTNSSVAPNGQHIRFMGKDPAPTMSISGAINSQSFFAALNTWSQKRYPLVLKDDLSQSWNVLIKEWKFTRLNRHSHPWRIDYAATFEVL